MSVGIEAAGDIATGMLIGRAVENRAGEAVAHDHPHGVCLNCGTALVGDYCHACGQSEHVHRSLASIGHDLLHGVFHFEGKIYRTLPMLVLHPGALTRRYIAGERARFVSPLALFLFSVFLLFAVINISTGDVTIGERTPAERAAKIAKLDQEIAKAEAELKQARSHGAKGSATAGDDADIPALAASVSAMKYARSAIAGGGADSKVTFHSVFEKRWPALDKGLAKANANPGLALYKMQSSAYKYSWGLIPISVPFVALLFLWRRRFQLYDHAIFVTYSLAFMMLLVVALTVAGLIGLPTGLIIAAALGAPPVHMFFQLRGAYQLRKRSALWRAILLTSFSFVALGVWGALLVTMGLME